MFWFLPEFLQFSFFHLVAFHNSFWFLRFLCCRFVGDWCSDKQESSYDDRCRKDWDIHCYKKGCEESTKHPTEKPKEVIRKLVLVNTTEGDTILDCFAGSGVVGVVCKELNRNCILIEKEEKFVKMINKRLAQEVLQTRTKSSCTIKWKNGQ